MRFQRRSGEKEMRKTACIATVTLLSFLWVAFIGVPGRCGQVSCDSMYYLLQNMAVAHVNANEIWVEHFLDCSATPDTVGGFVVTVLDTKGEKDRAVVGRYSDRMGWQYRFSERAYNIRFLRPSPRIDIDGDGELDMVFTTFNPKYLGGQCYRIVLIKDGKRDRAHGLNLHRDMAIDSILPAPQGHARPLSIIDRRGWEIGGLSPEKSPLSYRYLDWDNTSDPPGYTNRTVHNIRQYPVMLRRAAYVKELPDSGKILFDNDREYEKFLFNIIGYCLDQSNLGREVEAYEEVHSILDRVKYKRSGPDFTSPRQLANELRRKLPEVRNIRTKR